MSLISRSMAVLAGLWLIFSGSNDLSIRSAGNKGYGETSFAALNIRSRGSLKVGLGLIALSLLGHAESSTSASNFKNINSQSPSKKKNNGLLGLLGAPDPNSFERAKEKQTDQEN